jgi:hypothetical protein
MVEAQARVVKAVSFTVEEASEVWEVCKEMGYREWSPCLRHLIFEALKTRKSGGVTQA